MYNQYIIKIIYFKIFIFEYFFNPFLSVLHVIQPGIVAKLLNTSENYRKIYDMFEINHIDLKYLIIRTGYLNMSKIYSLLEKEHFINPLKIY